MPMNSAHHEQSVNSFLSESAVVKLIWKWVVFEYQMRIAQIMLYLSGNQLILPFLTRSFHKTSTLTIEVCFDFTCCFRISLGAVELLWNISSYVDKHLHSRGKEMWVIWTELKNHRAHYVFLIALVKCAFNKKWNKTTKRGSSVLTRVKAVCVLSLCLSPLG